MRNGFKNILLVDDDFDFVSLLTRQLNETLGDIDSISVANTYDEALDLLALHRFDFAIVDCFLGGPRTGLGLIREIRQRGFDFPIALLSAIARGPVRTVALGLGAVAAIDKARCTMEQLTQLIDMSASAWCDATAITPARNGSAAATELHPVIAAAVKP